MAEPITPVDPEDFTPGRLVNCKGGGPTMVISEPVYTIPGSDPPAIRVRCDWFCSETGTYLHDTFPLQVLVPLPSSPGAAGQVAAQQAAGPRAGAGPPRGRRRL